MNVRKITIILVKMGLLLALFYYLLSDLNVEKLLASWSQYSGLGVFLTVVVIVVSDVLFSLRWMLLSKFSCSFLPAFEMTVVSTTLNIFLPAKLGELSRLAYLKQVYGFSMNRAASMIVLEKFFDLVILAILTAIASLFVFRSDSLDQAGWVLVGLISFFIFAVSYKKFMMNVIAVLPVKVVRVYAKKIYLQVARHLTIKSIFSLTSMTAIIWGSYFFTVYVYFRYAAEFDLSMAQTMIVFLISVIAFSIPLSPGSIGVYEAALVLSLSWFGVEKEEALVSAIIFRAIQVLTPAVPTVWVMMSKDFSYSSLMKKTVIPIKDR